MMPKKKRGMGQQPRKLPFSFHISHSSFRISPSEKEKEPDRENKIKIQLVSIQPQARLYLCAPLMPTILWIFGLAFRPDWSVACRVRADVVHERPPPPATTRGSLPSVASSNHRLQIPRQLVVVPQGICPRINALGVVQ